MADLRNALRDTPRSEERGQEGKSSGSPSQAETLPFTEDDTSEPRTRLIDTGHVEQLATFIPQDRLSEMLEEARTHSQALAATLRGEKAQQQEVSGALHQLKGMAANLGMTDASQLAATLEKAQLTTAEDRSQAAGRLTARIGASIEAIHALIAERNQAETGSR